MRLGFEGELAGSVGPGAEWVGTEEGWLVGWEAEGGQHSPVPKATAEHSLHTGHWPARPFRQIRSSATSRNIFRVDCDSIYPGSGLECQGVELEEI